MVGGFVGRLSAQNAVLDAGGILSLRHPDAFFQDDAINAANAIGEYRKALFKAERFKVNKAASDLVSRRGIRSCQDSKYGGQIQLLHPFLPAEVAASCRGLIYRAPRRAHLIYYPHRVATIRVNRVPYG